MSRAPLVLAVLWAAVPALAGNRFLPTSKAGDAYRVGNMDVARGFAGAFPAVRLRWADDHTELVAAALSSASSWAQARSACRLMSPRGAWDLPSAPEAASVAKSEGLRVDLKLLSGAGFYPLWVFEGEEAVRVSKWYSNDTVVLLGEDGRVTGLYDLGALQMLAADPGVKNNDGYVRAFSELPKSPVVCVAHRSY